jgi:hypothetical protein
MALAMSNCKARGTRWDGGAIPTPDFLLPRELYLRLVVSVVLAGTWRYPSALACVWTSTFVAGQSG